MQQIAFFIARFVDFALTIFELLLFARAILSWFPLEDDNPLVNFLYMVTEPMIAPVRALLQRFSFFQQIPIDISFIVVFLLVSIVHTLLGLLI